MSVAKNVLTQRGYAIRDRAALQIEIETDLQTLRPRRRVGLYADAGDSSYGQIGAQIKSPFKKSDQRAPVTRYRVYVEVRGADKLPLWRGAVRTEATGADRFRVTRDMLQLLLERIGKAIENEILFIN